MQHWFNLIEKVFCQNHHLSKNTAKLCNHICRILFPKPNIFFFYQFSCKIYLNELYTQRETNSKVKPVASERGKSPNFVISDFINLYFITNFNCDVLLIYTIDFAIKYEKTLLKCIEYTSGSLRRACPWTYAMSTSINIKVVILTWKSGWPLKRVEDAVLQALSDEDGDIKVRKMGAAWTDKDCKRTEKSFMMIILFYKEFCFDPANKNIYRLVLTYYSYMNWIRTKS